MAQPGAGVRAGEVVLMSEKTGEADPRTDSARLEEALGHRFRDPGLLLRALTHRSFVNERPEAGLQHNEALEFLGDAVLGFLVSVAIYNRFPQLTEGELSKAKALLVSSPTLVRLAEEIGLGGYLRLGRGEDKTGGRHKRAILVDAFEALLGAVYLDGGVEAARNFIERRLGPYIEGLDPAQVRLADFKSALQEKLHQLGRERPAYRVAAEAGPEHRKTFVVEVLIEGRVAARATGRSKKEAEQEAARLALQELPGP